MAVFVVASWMPASLLRGLRVSFAAAVGRALGAAAAAHTGWLLAVGRQLGDQLGHLV